MRTHNLLSVTSKIGLDAEVSINDFPLGVSENHQNQVSAFHIPTWLQRNTDQTAKTNMNKASSGYCTDTI